MLSVPGREGLVSRWAIASRLRQLGRLLRENIGLLLFSLILALLLWLVVQNDQNPPRIDVVPSTLAVEPRQVPAGFAVYGIIDPISIRVAAPGDSWERLRASSFRVSVDLSSAAEGVGSYVPMVQVSDPRVRVVEVIPDRVDIRLEPIVSRPVPVRVAEVDSVPLGFRSQPARSAPTEARVVGPAPLVGQVDSAVAEVRLDGVRVNINESVKLVPKNAQGQPVEGIRVEPDQATIEITVEQQLHYRTVSVVPQFSGEPVAGYWIRAVSAEPATVTVAGERATVQDLNFLNTVPIDLTGLAEPQVRTVRLALPPGVSSVDGPTVRVRIDVAELSGTRRFSIEPRPVNAQPGLTYAADPVSVELAGPIGALQRTEASIALEVDVQGLGPGVHQLQPVVRLPDGVRLSTPLPDRVTITVR